jgi:hypothetical protein
MNEKQLLEKFEARVSHEQYYALEDGLLERLANWNKAGLFAIVLAGDTRRVVDEVTGKTLKDVYRQATRLLNFDLRWVTVLVSSGAVIFASLYEFESKIYNQSGKLIYQA